jgi:5'-nucleotidase
VEWCRRHLGAETPVHITEDKGLVYGKFLYDDFPEYCLSWLRHRPRGLVIMPETSWNKDFNHAQVLKYSGKNLDEVRQALLICLQRKKGEPLLLPDKVSP